MGRRCFPECASGRRCCKHRSCCRRCPAGVAAGSCVDLRGLAVAGDVLAVGEDLDLGQGERVLGSRQFDADEASLHHGLGWADGNPLGQSLQKRQHSGIQGGPLPRIADERHGADKVLQRQRRGQGQASTPYRCRRRRRSAPRSQAAGSSACGRRWPFFPGRRGPRPAPWPGSSADGPGRR